MATISLQCNSLSQIHSSIYFRLKIARQVSELLDKQMNAQKKNLKKYFRDSRELPQAHKNVR